MVRRRRTPPKSTTLTNCFETSFFPRRWRQVKDSALLALSSFGDICRPFVNLASRRSSLDSLLKRNSRENEEEPISVALYDYVYRIILSILFSSVETLGITRVKDGHIQLPAFTRLEVMTFRVRRVTFA